jgi:hypothetical protein
MVTYQKTFRPIATGTYQEWPSCYVGGWGGSHLTAMSDASDATWLQTSNPGSYNSFRDTFTVDTWTDTAIINNVRIYSRYKSTGAWAGTQEMLRTGGVDYYGSGRTGAVYITETYSDWSTNPNTAVAWTWEDISGMQIGVRGWQENTTMSYCYDVWMVVYYEYVSSTMPVGGVMIGPYLIG